MRTYRVELISTDPRSDFEFATYIEAETEWHAIKNATSTYAPHFEVKGDSIVEIMG